MFDCIEVGVDVHVNVSAAVIRCTNARVIIEVDVGIQWVIALKSPLMSTSTPLQPLNVATNACVVIKADMGAK